MKITDVRATLLSAVVPEEKRWRTDLGVAVKMDNCIVEVETDEGITGIGAGQGNPEVVKAVVETQLRPQLLGRDPCLIEGHWERMYSGSRGERRSHGVTPSPALPAGGTRCAPLPASTLRCGTSWANRLASRSIGFSARRGPAFARMPLAVGPPASMREMRWRVTRQRALPR